MLQSRPVKHIKLNSDLFQCRTHWEKGLLPETIMLEFNFRIKANHESLRKHFKDLTEVKSFVNENLSLNAISKISREVPLKDFQFEFAAYNYEREIDSVSRLFYNKHIKNFMFGFYIVFASKEEQRQYTSKEVMLCASDFIKVFSPKYFKNKTISKYFLLNK